MAEHYAWSDIHLHEADVDKDSKVIMSRKAVKVGEKVTKDMFPEDGEFDKLRKDGIIRDRPYPKVRSGESPKNALRRKVREEAEALDRGDLPLYDDDEYPAGAEPGGEATADTADDGSAAEVQPAT